MAACINNHGYLYSYFISVLLNSLTDKTAKKNVRNE